MNFLFLIPKLLIILIHSLTAQNMSFSKILRSFIFSCMKIWARHGKQAMISISLTKSLCKDLLDKWKKIHFLTVLTWWFFCYCFLCSFPSMNWDGSSSCCLPGTLTDNHDRVVILFTYQGHLEEIQKVNINGMLTSEGFSRKEEKAAKAPKPINFYSFWIRDLLCVPHHP